MASYLPVELIDKRPLAPFEKVMKFDFSRLEQWQENYLRIEIDDSGIVQIWIQPTRAHCPCCINDLMELRSEINQQKGVLACHIEVVGVPQADRWTAAINE